MLDVIVDAEIADVRERAVNGNLDSITYLATCIQKGFYTPKNTDRALALFNYVIARKEEIVHKETYWNALCQKTYIHGERGENEVIDQLALELIRDIVKYDPCEWDYGRLRSSVRWLEDRFRQENDGAG
ncbi:MAG: hypothetical protein MI974_12840 [Chitinophagales bacterium]|nr:hypothetical protein [Chitinophagales bacterium]